MSKSRRFVLWVVAALLTVAAAYVVGVQAGGYLNEQRRSERRDLGVLSTRAILDHMGTIDVGGTLPDVTLEDIDGQRHRLSDIVTEKSVISFIQTDCEACMVELEQIAAACRDTADFSKFIVISSANPLHLQKLRKNFGLGCYFLFDEDRVFGNGLKVSSFPFSIVVNDSLKILDVYSSGLPSGVLMQVTGVNK